MESTDPIVLEEGKIYKVKPPMISLGVLYQLARYAHENDLRFAEAILDAMYNYYDGDPFYMVNSELERRIKEFISTGSIMRSANESLEDPLP